MKLVSNDSLAGYDCANCGACCRCYLIFAQDSDAVREPKVREKGVSFFDNFLGKGLNAYGLYLLAYTKGEGQLCRIYETRPDARRRFTAGYPQCIKVRRWKGVGLDAARLDL